MAEKEVRPTTRTPNVPSLVAEIDALMQRIEKESKSPKKRYAIRFLRYAKGNL